MFETDALIAISQHNENNKINKLKINKPKNNKIIIILSIVSSILLSMLIIVSILYVKTSNTQTSMIINENPNLNTEWFNLANATIYNYNYNNYNNYTCDKNSSKSRDINRKAKMDSLVCPMYKFGPWISFPYCNMGPNCSTCKIIIHKTNNFMLVSEICYDKCQVYGRQCYKNIDLSSLNYNMKENYCSVIRLRCKSITPITPFVGLAQVFFL